jgi:allantoicase
VLLKLAEEGAIERMEVDTSHFKGNFPESCSLEACDADGNVTAEILPRTKLQAHTRHFFEEPLQARLATHVKFSIYPDGGVGRLRLYGTLSEQGRIAHKTRIWNALLPAEAEARLLKCCGSKRWAERMTDARPFADAGQMFAASKRIWWDLGREDWLEAFAGHPRIGERAGGKWSQQEQADAMRAPETTLDELVGLNQEYAERFGYIYIVCATSKTAEEMLALLRSRLHNDPDTELRIAAAEQSRITRLRLVK